MIPNLRLTLPQGVELSAACVEIQGYQWTKIKAEQTIGGAVRVDGKLQESEEEIVNDGETEIKEIEFTYAVWVNQTFKHQGKPHFGLESITLNLDEHEDLKEKLNNFAEHTTDLQKFESIGDAFLEKVL